MITYPVLNKGDTIGVTAPSSGVPSELYPILHQAIERMKKRGYGAVIGDTAWRQNKAKSAPASVRAKELNDMIQDEDIHIVIPPWGGELLLEIIAQLDYKSMNRKWVLGYSDVSVLLLAITLQTGMATAHGPNLVDLRGESMDKTTAMWESVLTTERGGSVIQYSSEKYQKEWQHNNPTPHIFHLTERTCWKTVGDGTIQAEGRLLGGCVDIIRHLIGTKYGDINSFRNEYAGNERILWYFENCELSATDLRRTVVQMKLAGWFDDCAGILFGRSGANREVDGYTEEDVYMELASELNLPIVYDVDCGHVPPQMTFINGAYARVEVKEGKGKVTQHFRP